MGDKKYYYLKLKDDFFEREEITVMESMPNGYRYVSSYIKMLCKSDFYSRGYRFIENRFKLTTISYLSKIFRCEDSYIVDLINTLTSLKLITIDGNKIIIKDINVDTERNRDCNTYREWRTNVFARDRYTCKKCNEKGVKIEAHHIKPWSKYPELRLDLENGITLCKKCHKIIHSKLR